MSKELIISKNLVEENIIYIRGNYVILDSVLAELYHTETKYINRATNRNPDRFPENFMFQLTDDEWENLKFQSGTSKKQGGRRTLPYVFTEQGVAMLSSVLQTPVAVKVSIQIINAFVEMRKLISSNYGLLQRIEIVEKKQLESEIKFEHLFKIIENKELIPNQGVFFDGQVFNAYEFISKIIRSAKISIILIDNFIDEKTLTHLSKKGKNVTATILTKNIDSKLKLDLEKANKQYGGFVIKFFSKSHDRFLIIDDTEIFHLGASLKDLGNKWFAFSKMNKNSVESILSLI